MSTGLTLAEVEVILESLDYSKQRIRDYRDHPSYEFKQQQLDRIEGVVKSVRRLRDRLRPNGEDE